MPDPAPSRLSLRVDHPTRDHYDVGVQSGLTIEFLEPVFDDAMGTWACAFVVRGHHGEVTKKVYGETALQALALAARFLDKLHSD